LGRNAATPGLIILVCAILGLLIAFVEQIAYANNWILPIFLEAADQLPGLQILTIVVWLLAGCILAAFCS
jgi:hypothetical protein